MRGQAVIVPMEVIKAGQSSRQLLRAFDDRFKVKGPYPFGRFDVTVEGAGDLADARVAIGRAASEVVHDWTTVLAFVSEEATEGLSFA